MISQPKTRSRSRPLVFLNLAVSADGKIATASRSVHSFGSPRDLAHLYELRATADAVMCGARTVEISNATLGNGGEKYRRRRLRNGLAEHPLRVIVSGSGSIHPGSKIFQKRFSPIILLTTRRAPKKALARLGNRVDEVNVAATDEIDFLAVLRWLHRRWGVRRLLCEGGGELNDALFRAGLVDEIHLTYCPKIFGGRDAPTLADGIGQTRLAGAAQYKLGSVQGKNGELFTVYLRQ